MAMNHVWPAQRQQNDQFEDIYISSYVGAANILKRIP